VYAACICREIRFISLKDQNRLRSLALVGLLLVVVLLSGCCFNIFQTARTVGAVGQGNVALGVVVMDKV